MTFTYIPDMTQQRDRVRFEIGDTIDAPVSEQLLQDEEIAYAATVEGPDLAVAARCCEAIAIKLARKADFTEGKLSIKLSQRANAYKEKAQLLRMAAGALAIPFAGGISIADKESTNDDTDRVQPWAFRGMLDNPLAQQQGPTDSVLTDQQND